jgi:hypothetical protein
MILDVLYDLQRDTTFSDKLVPTHETVPLIVCLAVL